jgi:hypothetical protein
VVTLENKQNSLATGAFGISHRRGCALATGDIKSKALQAKYSGPKSHVPSTVGWNDEGIQIFLQDACISLPTANAPQSCCSCCLDNLANRDSRESHDPTNKKGIDALA